MNQTVIPSSLVMRCWSREGWGKVQKGRGSWRGTMHVTEVEEKKGKR